MIRSTPRALAAAAVLVVLLLLAGPTSAAKSEGGGESQTWEHEWAATTAAGKALGTERLKVVQSASGTRFASGEVVPPGKKAVRTTTHLQRDAEGLHKYRRVRDERKGKGVFAFRKGAIVRVVPVNDSAKAAELASPRHLVWDPAALHVLEAWAKRLAAVTAAADLPVLDVPGRRATMATATPDGEVTLYDGKAKTATAVRALNITGLGAAAVRVYVTSAGQLVGVETSDRKLLRTRWAWAAPAVPEPPPATEPAAAKPATDADPGGPPEPGSAAAASRAIPDEEPGDGP